MASVEASGKTVDEAIAKALEQLGAGEDDVTVEVLEEGRGGVLGMGSAEARVLVTLVAENVADPAPPPDEASDGEADDGEEDEAEKAAQILDKLLELMGISAEVSIRDPETPGDGEGLVNAVLDVEGEDLGILIGRRGETLASLQFLLNLIASRSLGQRISFTVDVEGYRRRREKQLQQMARRLADQVKRSKRPAAMEPMPPNERRIIHLTLAEDRYVSTSSIGEGEARKVEISPRGGREQPE